MCAIQVNKMVLKLTTYYMLTIYKSIYIYIYIFENDGLSKFFRM